ncbi:BnaC08g47480D [Brassica napus]|uniref:BnaC08g47480D protein n=1 Tax=Brassica napus TaxID=3708 RepID=A0A078IYS2_BRANA|nr:BnaC08g47480D [Brassica napus]
MMDRKKRPMTALDYIKNQPRLQDKHLTKTTNTFSALAEFPPLSYAKAASSNSGQTSSKTATPTQKSDYYTKPYYQHIHTTYFPKPITLKELQNYINRVFYETSLWTTDNVTKNQTFYEYILVDSMSASIVHHENQNNPDQIDYSTCKIIRVASYRDLGFTNLHTQKPFNTPGFYIPGYTYTDYQNAFFYTFFRRPFTHSWFIQFQFNCPKLIPNWFYEWWYYFGPVDQIYPEPILKTSLPYYQKQTPQPSIPILSKIAFHIDMGIPWICSWHFHLTQLQPDMPMSLQQRPASPTGSGSSSKSKGKKAVLQEIFQALQKTFDVSDSESDEVNQQDEPMQDSEDPFGGPCAQDPKKKKVKSIV